MSCLLSVILLKFAEKPKGGNEIVLAKEDKLLSERIGKKN